MITTAKIEPGNIYQPPAFPWERRAFLLWQKDQTPLRRALDEKRLAAIFREAQRAPVLTEALDWAHSHGVAFMIDRQANNGSGYYIPGTGVVALVDSRLKDMWKCVGTLTHEIRHAWQDYHGMVPTGGTSLSGYLLRLGLVEADAGAHQRLAEKQYAHAARSGFMKAAPTTPAERSAFLRHEFQNWYREYASLYSEEAVRAFGARLEIRGAHYAASGREYDPYPLDIPEMEGLGMERYDDLQRLSRSFNGHHYFDSSSREFLSRKALAPDEAMTSFLSDIHPRFTKLALAVHKKMLQMKHATGKDTFITMPEP